MNERISELVLHPLRMRIIMAIAGRQMTTQQLAAVLGDVPQATLYRHINRLSEGGVLSVVTQRRVRGAVEKVYALGPSGGIVPPDEMVELDKEQHMRYFMTLAATLLEDFTSYLERTTEVDPITDGVGYHKVPLELSDQELVEMAQAVNQALAPFRGNNPNPQRRHRLFATVLIPADWMRFQCSSILIQSADMGFATDYENQKNKVNMLALQ